MTLQWEKTPLYSTTQYHRHHKNDRSMCARNSTRRMYVTSQMRASIMSMVLCNTVQWFFLTLKKGHKPKCLCFFENI